MIKVIPNDPKRETDAKKLEGWLNWMETSGFMSFKVDHLREVSVGADAKEIAEPITTS